MASSVLETIYEKSRQGTKMLAVLVDPDGHKEEELRQWIRASASTDLDFFFVGGSLLTKDHLEMTLEVIRSECQVPTVLFPGNSMQVSARAHAILFLSLISGRNPEYLIGNQVLAAPRVKASGLEVLPTGYMLIESGRPTTALYMSATFPIPADKPAIAMNTALAGKLMGQKLIFMDGGSGAQVPVPASMITAVKKYAELPLIIGGGIRSGAQAADSWKAGADILVVGHALENAGNPAKAGALLQDLNKAKKAASL